MYRCGMWDVGCRSLMVAEWQSCKVAKLQSCKLSHFVTLTLCRKKDGREGEEKESEGGQALGCGSNIHRDILDEGALLVKPSSKIII